MNHQHHNQHQQHHSHHQHHPNDHQQQQQQPQQPHGNVYLVRHAQSAFNLAQMKAMKSEVESKIEDLNVKFDPNLIDCPISELGFHQTIDAGLKVSEVNVTLVITSPLRRCLQTTHEMFKNHKNKPKVIVWPHIREMLLSACDVSDDLATIKKEFPDYDFSLLDKLPIPELWVLYSLKNEKLAQDLIDELFRKYSTREEAIKNAKFFIDEKLKHAYPNILENQIDINQRAMDTKADLKDKISQLAEGEAIVVVAHSRFLEALTAERYEQDGTPKNARWFHNCEVIPFKFN